MPCPSLLPSPPLSYKSPQISLSFPNPAVSCLKSYHHQHLDCPNCQHNTCALPQGWWTGSKHCWCNTLPVKHLFSNFALLDRIIVDGISMLFCTFLLPCFLFRISTLLSLYPLSFIWPHTHCCTLETIHLFTCKSGYQTSPCRFVTGQTDLTTLSFNFPFSSFYDLLHL